MRFPQIALIATPIAAGVASVPAVTAAVITTTMSFISADAIGSNNIIDQAPHVDKYNFLNPRDPTQVAGFADLAAPVTLCRGPSARLKVASFNIREAPANQSIAIPANITLEYPWLYRRDALLDQVLYEAPDVIGFQEVTPNQLVDINNVLSGEYSYVSNARDDGNQLGEAGPIFWRNDIFSLVSTDHFWLSETPDVVGSVGWDGAYARIATIVKLTYNQESANIASPGCSNANEPVYVLNTHFDHKGEVAREESSKLILNRLHAYAAAEEAAVVPPAQAQAPLMILTGDLNSQPSEIAYQTLTGHRYNTTMPTDLNTMFSTRDDLLTRPDGSIGTSLLKRPYGANGTVTGFQDPGRRGDIIDHILVLDNGATQPSVSNPENNGISPRWAATRYGVINNQFYDGQYPFRLSDHNMVTAVFNRLETGTS